MQVLYIFTEIAKTGGVVSSNNRSTTDFLLEFFRLFFHLFYVLVSIVSHLLYVLSTNSSPFWMLAISSGIAVLSKFTSKSISLPIPRFFSIPSFWKHNHTNSSQTSLLHRIQATHYHVWIRKEQMARNTHTQIPVKYSIPCSWYIVAHLA